MADATPMMRQYRAIKAEHGDAVLFFRLGDFYEMFDRDAKLVSSLLNLTLTHRNGLPMCGIPYHSVHTYIPKLLRHGKKIAICEQTSDPEKSKGIVDREVVEIITPGTVTEEEYLDRNKNNFIVSIGAVEGSPHTTSSSSARSIQRSGERNEGRNGHISISAVDLTTAEFFIRSFPFEEHDEKVREELARLSPSEVLIQESLLEERSGIARYFSATSGMMVNRYPDWYYDEESSYRRLLRQFSLYNLKGFGFEENDRSLASCGVLLDYVEENAKHLLSHITSIHRIEEETFVGIDEATQKNLELTRNLSDRDEHYTLIEAVDDTKTPMGGRRIRNWILYPLRTLEEIERRQKRVELLYKDQLLLSELRSRLSSIRDLERLASRVALDKAHGKDLLAVAQTVETIFSVEELLSGQNLSLESLFTEYALKNAPEKEGNAPEEEGLLGPLRRLVQLLERAVHEDPAVTLTDGRLIKDGYNEELDSLRQLKTNSKRILDEYLEEEKNLSGIGNLKIKYNKIIGYFLEVTKSHADKVPDHFIRRQSLVGSERYTTERLNTLQEELNNASERIIELEKKLFIELREMVKEYVSHLMEASSAVAVVDCLQSLAQVATLYGWNRPSVHDGSALRVEEGRHPVVEAHSEAGSFIPNSIELDSEKTSFALITGPNMSGKSTYLRQVALIVLLSQIGSFVPADEAEVGMVDRIFCRVGASDNLARGESTFLVEMNETAYILNTAGPGSLVIMDEVGRGTGTADGLSIAWAVSEQLLRARSKTLFATHYHELGALESDQIRKLHLQVKEEKGEIIFLKRVQEGTAGRSYGLHVAKLAGLPQEVLDRAGELLLRLDSREKELSGLEGGLQSTDTSRGTQNAWNARGLREAGDIAAHPEPQGGEEKTSKTEQQEANGDSSSQTEQPSLFSPSEMLIGELKQIDINRTTPLEALNLLERWRREYGTG